MTIRARRMFACLFTWLILSPAIEPVLARKGSRSEVDLIEMSLAAAQRAQARGEWGAVRSWAALVVASVERGAALAVTGRNAGNAAQLLDVLQLYDRYAYGREAGRDARVDSLVAALFEIETLHRQATSWRHGGASAIDFDLSSSLVRRHRGRSLDYDSWTRQIVRFGDVDIDYDPWTRMPRRIGPVEITYDPFRDYPRTIAGVEIR